MLRKYLPEIVQIGIKYMNKIREKLMEIIFLLCAIFSIVALGLICIFLVKNGLPAFKEIGIGNFLFGTHWKPSNTPAEFGILPMILGSLYVTVLAIGIGVPVGIFTAIYLVFNAPKKVYEYAKPCIQVLAGIPSVVYGFFGMLVLVPFVSNFFGGNGFSILTAGILLAIMILPTIISITEVSLKAVPTHYYEGAVALGGTHERAIFNVVLPAAKSGVFTGVVLGIGRAIGETMAVVMVAGNQARIPNGLLKGARTMTSNIVLEMGYASGLHREALIATAIVLFIFILAINFTISIIKRRSL